MTAAFTKRTAEVSWLLFGLLLVAALLGGVVLAGLMAAYGPSWLRWVLGVFVVHALAECLLSSGRK